MSENDPLARIEHGVTMMERRRQWESENRLALLWGHAVIGLVGGILMVLYSTATAWERIFINMVPDNDQIAQVVIGTPAIIGGFLLGFGLSSNPRNMITEMIGLCFLLLWELLMTGAMIWGAFNPAPGSDPVPYPIAVYGGLAYFMCVHIRSLYRWTVQSRIAHWWSTHFRRSNGPK